MHELDQAAQVNAKFFCSTFASSLDGSAPCRVRLLSRQDCLGVLGELGRVSAQDALLDRWQLRRMHRKAPQSHGQQEFGELNVTGHLTTHADMLARLLGRCDHLAQQAQHCGMLGFVEVGNGLIRSVYCQGVLNEIVRANGKEIEMP